MNPGQPLQLHQFLPAGFTPEELVIWLAAGAAFLVVWSIGHALTERDRLGPRLKALQQRRQELKHEYTGPRKRRHAPRHTDLMRHVVTRIKLLKDHQLEAIGQRMVQAGYHSKDAVIVYSFAKLVGPFLFLGLALLLAAIDWDKALEPAQMGKLMLVLIAAYAGAKLPDILVTNQRMKRYAALRRSLADTLDLMLICAEAGLSLTATLDRVARELGQAYPEMAEELGLTSIETGFLPDRNMALRHLAERVDIREVRSMVNVLLQTEKYGTPISQALRVLSKDFRTERMLRAEQKAARLPAIMTIPMIILILPTMFIIVMTPAIINVLDTF